MRHHGALALCWMVASAVSASVPAVAKNTTTVSNSLPPPAQLVVTEQPDGFVIQASSDGFPCPADASAPDIGLGSSVRLDPRIAPALPAMFITEEAHDGPLR